jgi:hypothetical protein
VAGTLVLVLAVALPPVGPRDAGPVPVSAEALAGRWQGQSGRTRLAVWFTGDFAVVTVVEPAGQRKQWKKFLMPCRIGPARRAVRAGPVGEARLLRAGLRLTLVRAELSLPARAALTLVRAEERE